jgi:hypothetical protein
VCWKVGTTDRDGRSKPHQVSPELPVSEDSHRSKPSVLWQSGSHEVLGHATILLLLSRKRRTVGARLDRGGMTCY